MCTPHQQGGCIGGSNNGSSNYFPKTYDPILSDEPGMVDGMADVWWSQWCGSGLDPDGSDATLCRTESENDIDDLYVDYSCMSSGLLSPDIVCSGPPVTSYNTNPGRMLTEVSLIKSEVDSGLFSFFQDVSSDGKISPTAPSVPSSPSFCPEMPHGHLPTDDYDSSYCGDGNFGRQLSEFGSEEEAVKNIARYLASFEVQPRFAAGLNRSPDNKNRDAMLESGLFQNKSNFADRNTNDFQRIDDYKLNAHQATDPRPNDAYPVRVDHGYAAKPPQPNRPRKKSVHHGSKSSSRRNSTNAASCSVLEVFLTTTRSIDPNKGSNAALAEENNEHGLMQPGKAWKSPTCSSERLLKRLLTGEVDQREMVADRKRLIETRNRRLLETAYVSSPKKLMQVDASSYVYLESKLLETAMDEIESIIMNSELGDILWSVPNFGFDGAVNIRERKINSMSWCGDNNDDDDDDEEDEEEEEGGGGGRWCSRWWWCHGGDVMWRQWRTNSSRL